MQKNDFIMNVDNTDDNMKRMNTKMKKRFYDYVDKYLMAIQIDIEEYETLPDTTLAEFAFKAARTCRNCFEIAWEYDEVYNDGYIERKAPELDDEQLAEKTIALVEKYEQNEYERDEDYQSLRKFLNMICGVADIDVFSHKLRKCYEDIQRKEVQLMNGVALENAEEVNDNE